MRDSENWFEAVLNDAKELIIPYVVKLSSYYKKTISGPNYSVLSTTSDSVAAKREQQTWSDLKAIEILKEVKCTARMLTELFFTRRSSINTRQHQISERVYSCWKLSAQLGVYVDMIPYS